LAHRPGRAGLDFASDRDAQELLNTDPVWGAQQDGKKRRQPQSSRTITEIKPEETIEITDWQRFPAPADTWVEPSRSMRLNMSVLYACNCRISYHTEGVRGRLDGNWLSGVSRLPSCKTDAAAPCDLTMPGWKLGSQPLSLGRDGRCGEVNPADAPFHPIVAWPRVLQLPSQLKSSNQARPGGGVPQQRLLLSLVSVQMAPPAPNCCPAGRPHVDSLLGGLSSWTNREGSSIASGAVGSGKCGSKAEPQPPVEPLSRRGRKVESKQQTPVRQKKLRPSRAERDTNSTPQLTEARSHIA
jgi:hypothetical protein